ncbi:hypothetical protein FX985_01354 [Pseudomonas extremaustralis]|uniref:Uncharacterized protein n=1 Tax=Pseudomonas extremaustralis TaxID=359110 RepID=A0A5M9IZC1_9PSED|nr:hypothetical protein FX985_01354 [Pseudomonas extremaustralis]
MTLHAVVTVDLDNGVSSSARTKFNEALKAKKLTKHKLTTLWTGVFTTGTTREWAIKYSRDAIDEAASAAGITTYEAFVSISEAAPVEWKRGPAETLLGLASRFR